jgi:hypothetical protein
MAPLETMTNERSFRLEMVFASRSQMSGPSLASVREPILTITRRARATTLRGSVMLEEVVEASIEPSGKA